MPIALSAEHEDLRRTVRRWLEAHCPPEVPRATLEPDADPTALPPVWKELAAQGWLGLHLEESFGGEGFGLVELAVVLEEFGRSMVPGPVLPTLLASALVQRAGDDDQRRRWLPRLADGSMAAAVYFGGGALFGMEDGDGGDGSEGGLTVSGELRPVLGAPHATLLLVPAEPGGWCLVESKDVAVEPLAALDPTRPLGVVKVESLRVPAECRLAGLDTQLVADLAMTLSAAEAAGGASWCVETAADYAKSRVQFGRSIGQFQAVKHKLADVLVLQEQLVAVAWDAARAFDRVDLDLDLDLDLEVASLTASVAGALSLDGFADCAKACIQVLGGIGFTWEHDAHLYLKRALATRPLLGQPDDHRGRVTALAAAGTRRELSTELPPEAEEFRAVIVPLVEQAASLEGDERREFLCDEGLLVPHWPRPFGRDAGPVEQLVIEAALGEAGIKRPNLGVGAWALPTLVAHGTPGQQERWVRPTLLGRLHWCQLFSEPGAGSDLASLSMKAVRADDGAGDHAAGWKLTGQKVWTSMAQFAQWGICLARTDPTVPKHDGISYFVVDMSSAGVDIRPMRELTGAAMFNEVFFDDVFVPDDCLIGAPGQGWRIGRTTLDNERVSISSGSTFGTGVESVLRRFSRVVGDLGPAGAPVTALRLGALLAEAQSLHLLGEQAVLRSLSGLEPGAGASVRKLLGAEHEQRVQEAGLSLYGAEGAVAEGSPARWNQGVLATRCLTIAGGTSEVQRNVIAERLLGLPKDPEPGH